MNHTLKPDVSPPAAEEQALTPGRQTSRVPSSFSALRSRNYRLYFGGQLISNIGTWMQIIAQGWLVFQISHSERDLGIVSFAAAIPALLMTAWGGVVVDRVDKRKVLVITQTAMMLLAFILAALTFSGVVQVWQVVVLSFMTGVINAFDAPARMAFLVDIVERKDLPNAIALNSLMFNSARAIGPAIGGILLALLGAGWCFTINGISFLAVIVSLILMRLPAIQKKTFTETPWQQLSAGVRYVRSQRDILSMILLALVFSLFGISYWTILPAFVSVVLNSGPTLFGAITAASGIGAVCGALVLVQPWVNGRRGRWLNVANLTFPPLMILFAYLPYPNAALVLAFLLGVGFMMQFTLINTLIQTVVEDDLRGRVMGLYTLTFFGIAPFGNLLIGAAAESYGISLTILVAALLTLVLGRLIFWRDRDLRKLA